MTEDFFITTYSPNFDYAIDKGYNKTTQMSIKGDLKSFTANPTNLTNGAVNTYVFNLSTKIPLQNVDILMFDLPEEIVAPRNTKLANCQPMEGLERVECSI